MKLGVLLVILAVGIMPISAYAESNEFGFKLFPEKILEYTDGTLQIFVESNGLMIPREIIGLKTSSSDSSVIKIIGLEPANEFITNIKIQAQQPGEAKISLAAPGFSSQEILIKVYDNNNYPTQIQMKITPEVFPVDGPKFGHIGIELLTTSGLPTKAEEDTIIKFSTPNKDVIELQKDEVLIKKGEYFALNEFKILESGEPIIFAETEGMKRISQFISVQEGAKPYRIEIYAFPSTFTSYSNPNAFIVVQLQDSQNIPIIAEEDIHVRLTSTNPDVNINTSTDFEEISFGSKELVIEAGSYWAYTSFSNRAELGSGSDFREYAISAYSDDYIATHVPVTVVSERVGGGEVGSVAGGGLIGEGPAIFYALPFLTTGEKELIGIAVLETTITIADTLESLTFDEQGQVVTTVIADSLNVPVQASKDFVLDMGSTSLNTLTFENPLFKKGKNAVPVFGYTGTMAPKDCKIEFYTTDTDGVKRTTGFPYGPIEITLSLIVEPLIPKVLAGSEFPLIGYLNEAAPGGTATPGASTDDEEISCYDLDDDAVEESGRFGITQFTEDTIITFSANEDVEIEPAFIKQNQPYAIMYAKSNKVGSTSLEMRGSGLAAGLSITSHTTDPTSFGLAYATSSLPKLNTLSALQVLDSAGNPVYAKEDIEITLVSNNESVLKVPNSLSILKDEYRVFFDMNTYRDGDSEVAILSEDLPLARYDLNVKGIKPKINFGIDGSGLVGQVMTATIAVSYPGVNLSAGGLDVEWVISGAEIIHTQAKTDENGKAIAELVSNNPSTASIRAIVNGVGVSDAESMATYSFAHPEGYVEIVESDNSGLGGLGIDDSQLIYFIVPGALAGAFLFLKRTNRLEGISERLPIGGLGEKFEDIKDRVSEMRDRD